MRFKDRKQQLSVQNAERADPAAQALLKEFCELINLPYQQQQGLFAVGFYTSFMRMPEIRPQGNGAPTEEPKDEQVEQTGDETAETVPGPEAEAAGDLQPDSSDDDSYYSEPGRIPEHPGEQAENPASPSSS
jgi:hypothetical protein